MSYLLVPQAASSDSATLWVGAVGDEPVGPDSPVEVRIGDDRSERVSDLWQTFVIDNEIRMRAQRMQLAGLEPDRRYPVRLIADGVERATATVVTLPDSLPTLDRNPFICLLGSCFAGLRDSGGSAGAAYVGLPAAARPHLKFLCGDQVYLDTPAGRFLTFFGESDLREILLARYLDTWAQVGFASGFSRMLREGATYLASDDHEFWNNAPNKTPLVRNTYWWPIGDEGRTWMRAARELYALFQATTPSAAFAVGRLSFRTLDTRIGRTGDRRQFVDPAELSALATWVNALTGPGVLVVGQPIFYPNAGLRGNFTDWGLADFEQYADLVRILQAARHDLLILTGDVHYGRVSWCRLPSGATLTEIIASPFALVSGLVGGHWYRPPGVFPAAAVPGAVQLTVEVLETHQLTSNHFATLEFWADGSRVRMSVKAWPIPDAGIRPNPTLVYQRILS